MKHWSRNSHASPQKRSTEERVSYSGRMWRRCPSKHGGDYITKAKLEPACWAVRANGKEQLSTSAPEVVPSAEYCAQFWAPRYTEGIGILEWMQWRLSRRLEHRFYHEVREKTETDSFWRCTEIEWAARDMSCDKGKWLNNKGGKC